MNMSRNAIFWVGSAVLAASVVVPSFARADNALVPATTQPTTEPTAAVTPTAAPASTQPSVSPEAQALLAQIKTAYASLKSLDITATIDANFDVDGEKQNHHSDIKALFQSGGKFRSEIKDDALVGNTGDKQFVYLPDRNAYIMMDTPKDKSDLSTLAGQVTDMVRDQNLSLALALAPDAGAELIEGASNVARAADVTIDGAPFNALTLTEEGADIVVAVDPQTHLIRRQNLDLTKTARLRGAHEVKTATVVVDFKSTADAPITAAQFAWAPPAGSQEIKPEKEEDSPLKGKPAPAFTLAGLDGKEVKSDDLKGSVYILDFWATWCGPCVAALPALDKIYQDNQKAGLKVFAVNQGEDKDTVQKFVTKHNLTIPALLDGDSKVGQAYGANAIPETVVIGKDGIVVAVFVGGGKDEEILKAAQGAMKGN